MKAVNSLSRIFPVLPLCTSQASAGQIHRQLTLINIENYFHFYSMLYTLSYAHSIIVFYAACIFSFAIFNCSGLHIMLNTCTSYQL